MSQDSTASDTTSASPGTANEMPDHVYLVSYPKIVFFYPTVLTALFCGVFMWAKGGIPQDEIRVSVRSDNVVGIPDPMPGHQRTRFASAAYPAFADEPTFNTESGSATETSEPKDTASSSPPTTEGATGEKSDAINTDTTTAVPAADPATTSDVPETTTTQKSDLTNNSVDSPAADRGPVHTYHNVCARIFLLVMALNLVVIAFDFPRTTSLTWFFAIVSIVIGLWFILKLNPWLAPRIVDALLKIKPAANASFYLIFSGIMIFLYLCVLVSRRFDFWEVKGNELLHHHGFLSNLERFSAPNLRIDKEINDVFEYLLLRSGRLIIHASNERRAIVLENVLFINEKEERITKMLGALQVRVRTERE